MFDTGDTLYIMPTRYAGGKAITPFSNLTFDKLDTSLIPQSKRALEDKGYNITNAIVGGGDLWVLSPRERSEYLNYICGEFESVCVEIIPTSIFETTHSNCFPRYLFDFCEHTTKSRELFNLKQISNAHLISYLNTTALKYGFNNCTRIASSIEGVKDIYYADWIYKTDSARNAVKNSLKQFKNDMNHSRIKTTLRIKNLEPTFSNKLPKTVYLFPNGILAKANNNILSKV